MSGGQVETSDMNDGDILAKTTQIPCGKGGSQFKYILPDGHPITSECVSQEQKKQALHAWVDAVKGAAVARVKSEREELAARIRRQKADAAAANEAQNAEAMGLIVPAGTAAASQTPVQQTNSGAAPSVELVRQTGAPSSTDPVAMAKAELVRAAMEVQELQPRLVAAQQRVAQWQAVLGALQAVELPKESAVISLDNRLTQET